jgi:octaprenyl-diphosphate synthase
MFSTPPLNIIADEMKAVDELIIERLSSDVVLINQMGHYIVKNGGKRLRPALVLLSAGVCGHTGEDARLMAAIVEFIHTATLLHDDVVDESELRRGHETANAVWGNEASVLVGDFLYSRSFELMVELERMRVMEVFARTTNLIAAGEVMQLMNVNDADTTEERYFQVIERKTAKLFEAACQLGAVTSDASAEDEAALAKYGLHLGNAFQIVDDVLDYAASEEKLGKELGDDLAEGKPTLPLIYAMQVGDDAQTQLIRDAIEAGDRNSIDAVMEVVKATGAIDYSMQRAAKEADYALEQLHQLPNSGYKDAMEFVVNLAVQREY